MADTKKAEILKRDGRPDLAYIYTPGSDDLPLVMFCGGYRSDMRGTKAAYFEAQCEARGQAYVRFDYSGHGESEGNFEDGTIGQWAQDAKDVLEHVADGPVLLIGSSMGGWISMLLAKKRSGTVSGMIGLAAAPDFTEDMFETRLDDAQKTELMEKGLVAVPNDYSDEPYHFTKAFYDEAKQHLLLNQPQNTELTIRLVQGMQDQDVPWQTAIKIQKNYIGGDVDVIFIDDGDHRLSRPEDLELVDREILSLSDMIVRD